MVIQVGYTTDPNEKIKKTFHATRSFNNAKIKEDTSIIDPVLIITQPVEVATINYVYIPSLERYYYINDIIGRQGNTIELHCHCDVLKSFQNEILSSNAIIDKTQNSSNSNVYLNDGDLITECKDTLQSYEFPAGFTSTSTIIITAGG